MARTHATFNWDAEHGGVKALDWLKANHKWLNGVLDHEQSAKALAGLYGKAVSPDGVRLKVQGIGGRAHRPLPIIEGLTADYEDRDPEEVWTQLVAAQERWEARERVRKVNRVTFPKGVGAVGIAIVGDLHIGGMALYREMRDDASRIADAGCATILLGDYLNNWVVSKLVGLQREEVVPHAEALTIFNDWLQMLGPTLCVVVGGNHDNWSSIAGLDYVRSGVRSVNPKVLWDKHECYFTLAVGEREKKVLARHKWRGSSKYNPTHAIESFARFGDKPFDIGLGGHIHSSTVCRPFYIGDDQTPKLAFQVASYKRDDDYQRSGGWAGSYGTGAGLLIVEEDGAMHGYSNLATGIDVLKGRQRAWQEA